MHLRVIYNGKFGIRQDVRGAVEQVRAQGHEVSVRVTWESGDARRMAHDAALETVDAIAAAGGDGTLNECAAGLLDAGGAAASLPSLSLMPLGAANDFALSQGFPAEPYAALAHMLEAEATPIDIATLNGQSFVNMATGGFPCEVTTGAPEPLKRVLGGAAYLITGISRAGAMQPAHASFEGPGLSWEGDFLLFAVGNGPQAGGGHCLCPGARIDDGLLDVLIVPALPAQQLVESVGALLSGGLAEDAPLGLIRAALTELHVKAAKPVQINLDGEPVRETSLDFRLKPGAIRLHRP